jgi:N-acetylneuraminate synthase
MQTKGVYIIAEAGVNHNGNKEMAFRLVDAAAEAGADAVKFQTFKAKKLASTKVGKADYQKQTTGDAESQLSMLQALELPESWHRELQVHANAKGIDFLSTAFDEESLNFLNNLDLPLFKMPSGELTNAPLVWKFARTGKPLIISTGMATLSEVEQALAIITHALNARTPPKNIREVWDYWSDDKFRNQLKTHVTLLHCTSQYPTPWEKVNLRAMDTLSTAFNLPVGYSDHTEDIVIPLAAVARGATVIEKHFTLDRSLPGPDHKASLEVEELKKMVQGIRALEVALGSGNKSPQPGESELRNVARQYIVAAKSIAMGQIITEEDLTTSRTGGGLEPSFLWELLGTKSRRNYEIGDIF